MIDLYTELKGIAIGISIWAIAFTLTALVHWLGLPNYCVVLTFMFSYTISQIVFFKKHY